MKIKLGIETMLQNFYQSKPTRKADAFMPVASIREFGKGSGGSTSSTMLARSSGCRTIIAALTLRSSWSRSRTLLMLLLTYAFKQHIQNGRTCGAPISDIRAGACARAPVWANGCRAGQLKFPNWFDVRSLFEVPVYIFRELR